MNLHTLMHEREFSYTIKSAVPREAFLAILAVESASIWIAEICQAFSSRLDKWPHLAFQTFMTLHSMYTPSNFNLKWMNFKLFN